MKKLIVDIDDTLIKSDLIDGEYCNARPIKEEISYLTKLYEKGYTIIIWTGRHWNHYEITKKQLEEFGVKYHELIMGKPPGIYIDRDALKSCRMVECD